MKKRLLILGTLFFLFIAPKNAFAATKGDIFFYDQNNNLLGRCLNTTQCYINSVSELGRVRKIVLVDWETPLVPGAKYKLETTFIATSQDSRPPLPSTKFTTGTTPLPVQEGWFGINEDGSNSEGLTRSFGYQGTLDSSLSGTHVNFEFTFPYNTTITSIKYISISVKTTGTSTNDAISGATNAIIQNQNENFGKLEDKMNENTEAIKELDKTQKDQLDEQKKTNEALTDSDTSGAENVAGDIFKTEEDSYGLADIIKIPLVYISSLEGGTCQSVSVPIPFVNSNVILPCMNEIYQIYFPEILNIWQIISTGLIAYGVGVNIVGMVKGFKDPQNDRVEVLEL